MIKQAVIDAAQSLDAELLQLLISHEAIKRHFFQDVGGVLVFDKVKLLRFVSNKAFLEDSYTAFKNKIGLVTKNSDGLYDAYLSDSKEVVLAYPYKDCMLEGGQTKEEEARKEIFWNETLAPDDIDRLKEPKAFSKVKRYDAEGVHENVTNLSLTDNYIIKGNNLLALYSLLPLYRGKVKLIYIDPPYNTGGAANTFAYNNSFNHSSWYAFMRNRLEVSKLLLAENGVICIAIDDEEYAHLKVLCDEIFKRDNFVGTVIVQSNPRGRTINSHFATTHEYALFYSKNKDLVEINNQPLNSEQEKAFGKSDEDGDFRFLPFRRSGGTSTPEERPNSEFSLIYSKTQNKIIAVGGERIDLKSYQPKEILTIDEEEQIVSHSPDAFRKMIQEEVIEILPIDTSGKRRVWRWSDRKEILLAAKKGDFNIVSEQGKYTVQLKDRIKDGRKPKTIWNDSKYDASSSGTMLLKKMFDGDKLFSYPKSLFTVKDTIQILTNSEDNDIVLDFFGGSGTSGHAVLELNKEDNGNRKFILCEQMDYIESVTSKRIKKVIDTNCEGSFVYMELAKANQHFVEQIQSAKTEAELLDIWHKMQTEAFISYKVTPDMIDKNTKDYEALSIEDKRRFLIEILDKNLLYVPHCDMESKEFGMSETDKKATTAFYDLKTQA